ncbi:MAG: radical SAM protein [Eubacteriales bacterium]|nr:radical SAM protein [Eubacteriales bacterium]
MIEEILARASQAQRLSRRDALVLLAIDVKSQEFYALLATANARSREAFCNRGYIFAQIGINAAPCSGNCTFCSLARDTFAAAGTYEKSPEEVLAQVRSMDCGAIDALFLMTTADYPQDKFLELGRQVRDVLPQRTNLVANIGDFGPAYAEELKKAGFAAVYHIVRLGEGKDTALAPTRRIATLDAIRGAGLELYYCVEPIGPEHTQEQLVDEMLRARDYDVDVMAVMARTPVPGTPFAGTGKMTQLEMTKIAAVTRLVTDPKRSMNIHEPQGMALLAGVNQLYAELGANPRDVELSTESGRGFSVEAVRRMLLDAHYEL